MSLRALLTRSEPQPQSITVTFDREVFEVRVRRHRQARRYTLRIQATTRDVVLTMPLRGSMRQATEFAHKHGGWIAARLKRLPEPEPFAHGGTVPLRGVMHRIEHRQNARGTVWAEAGDDGSHTLCVAGASPNVARRVEDFLKREAKRDLDAASRAAAARIGVAVKRISIRDQASRWGSCSSTGVLSYSWRLIMAPPFVLDYLAAHEVAHLVEMNHSRAFWRIVADIYPDLDRAKAWLEAHGAGLHRYGTQS